jgi:hypothetical protein
MSDRPFKEIREAYELWAEGNDVNGIPREPKPSWDIEFGAFMQGYYFGRMTDADFAAVVERLRHERAQQEPEA